MSIYDPVPWTNYPLTIKARPKMASSTVPPKSKMCFPATPAPPPPPDTHLHPHAMNHDAVYSGTREI